ncbi:glycosyltransferase [Cytobacillus sp. FJAT-54145]|uniref:4,4'-diaponeurosporenoate glycosyltransferase n=1 Tax=Cytobacillus spartinae TaxID=3299023 RepID=A0ABW6KCZ0_9BACI
MILQLLWVIWNLQHLPILPKDSFKKTDQTISILIPARNEGKRIGDCLQSIVKQKTPPYEVLVLDDHSTDDTAEVVKDWMKKYPFIKLIKGAKLQQGWTGKSFACHQLAMEAKGDWLLFLDADVRLFNGALEKVCNVACTQRTGMISGFPKQVVQSWMERLVVPMMMFVIACHLPIKWVRKSNNPRFAAAHGGFIFIEKNCYMTIGGHRKIRNDLLDDMALAKLVKRNLYPFVLADITNVAYMRMYEKASDVWEGYRKNLFPGLNRNFLLLLIILLYYFGLYLFPILVFVFEWNNQSVLILAFFAYIIGAFTKGWIDYKNGLTWWYGLMLPVSIFFVLCIGLDSAMRGWTNKGYTWKGRSYL